MSGLKIILVAVILVALYISSYMAWRHYRADLFDWYKAGDEPVSRISPSLKIKIAPGATVTREIGRRVPYVEYAFFYPCICAEVVWSRGLDYSLVKYEN